ncbi:hypothetical protein PMIN02_009434 [Paraphaeosphaeria minitans]|uniref:MFS general substrate transporter n=1 Tax=Paraphaeosphaeria minitans TaxID=565426 RepID=A0A9P6G8Q7_9PLEO|nr:hypothetical protein PMIN01_11136 [Paraphaeosphaeria minitans]
MAANVVQQAKKAPEKLPNKVKPGVTGKKLPWLDGRSSIASSPLESPSGHASIPMREGSISPLSRQPTLASMEIDYEPDGGPSNAVKRVKESHVRCASAARFIPTPVGPSEPRKRLSIVHKNDSEVFLDIRSRVNSLAPVPDHLERIETPNSILRPVQHIVHAPPPTFIQTVQRSPNQPVPRPSVFERHSHRRLSHTIEGLEDLVEEAVITAERTERPEHVEQIYAIIEDASIAIQDASSEPARHLMRTSSPLQVAMEEVSQFPSRLPTHLKALETVVEQIHNIPKTQLRNVEQRQLEKIDWAYRNAKDFEHHHQHFRSSSSSSTSSIPSDRQYSHASSPSDLLQLLPPPPIATASRDHVDRADGEAVLTLTGDAIGTIVEAMTQDRTHRADVSAITDLLNLTPPFMKKIHMLLASQKASGAMAKCCVCEMTITIPLVCIAIITGNQSLETGQRERSESAGEVPRIQYVLADEHHRVILGNVALYFGLAFSTFVCWPLPLLHGRKPYILASLALAMPLQFPQALVMSQKRSPTEHRWIAGLLIARGFTGFILGFANVNFISILLDLFGASLQSKHPHQEFMTASDVRRHGGGMGIWLGFWSWCWLGSLAGGFQIGAGIIDSLTPDWGFYITIMILAGALLINVMMPETRRSAYRRSVTEVYDREENYITRRVARGEIKLHISTEGPKYWFEEVWAGLKLSTMMLCQPGFLALSLYLGWIYTQIVLVIVLLGALLSRDYKWHSQMVGLGVMSIAIGAVLAIPLTKAGIFSRERKNAFRTDSMTFQKQVSWSSHLIRRCIFTLVLPLMGLAYTVSSASRPKPFMVPIVFAGAVGFFSILAIAECYGLIMETFDTCDLQPGVNTRHRLQSMAVEDRRRRTNYSSFPRVSAGIFTSHAVSFVGAAVATEVGGIMTRHIGAQASTGVTAGILLFLTFLLTLVLWRFKEIQVIPNHTFGTRRDTAAWQEFKELEKVGRGAEWKAVVIRNPSGKMRRMSVLELGALSRWTEIRKLNFLIKTDDRARKRDDWHHGGSW